MAQIKFHNVNKKYGAVIGVEDLNLTIEHGEFVCLLGPSGCGKSTSLRMLAGLDNVTSGQISVDRQQIDQIPARKRDIAMVFENYALYPHFSAFDNIANPLRVRGVSKPEIERRVLEIAETLNISHLLNSRPGRLSGGEKQRVGIGRAIVRNPKIFLMDEPLGHLEAYMRVTLRSEIRRLHDKLETTTVFVTHDQEEAAAIADRIAVMKDGKLQQIGTLDELLDTPANKFVAEFIGEIPINIIEAKVGEQGASAVKISEGPATSLVLAQTKDLTKLNVGDDISIGVRPWDIVVCDTTAADVSGLVQLLEPQGDTTIVSVETTLGTLTSIINSDTAPKLGERIGLHIPLEQMNLFASDGNNILGGKQ